MSDYTIYLTDEEVGWTEELQEKTGASSRSKVLRDALEYYRAEITDDETEGVAVNGR